MQILIYISFKSSLQDIESLSKIGFSVHSQTVHKKLISWQDNLDMDLNSIRDSLTEGGQTKFQIIGDNWDKIILTSYRTSDRKTLSLHLFNMYAIVDLVVPASSTDSLTENRPELDNLKFIPSTQEQELLLEEMTFLRARSVMEICTTKYILIILSTNTVALLV